MANISALEPGYDANGSPCEDFSVPPGEHPAWPKNLTDATIVELLHHELLPEADSEDVARLEAEFARRRLNPQILGR